MKPKWKDRLYFDERAFITWCKRHPKDDQVFLLSLGVIQRFSSWGPRIDHWLDLFYSFHPVCFLKRLTPYITLRQRMAGRETLGWLYTPSFYQHALADCILYTVSSSGLAELSWANFNVSYFSNWIFFDTYDLHSLACYSLASEPHVILNNSIWI